jgi:hypothetical protein
LIDMHLEKQKALSECTAGRRAHNGAVISMRFIRDLSQTLLGAC